MYFYYVRQRCTLALPHKVAERYPPSVDALQTRQIPLGNIYCGAVVWEIAQARTAYGDDAVVIQEFTPEIESLLPPRIRARLEGGDLPTQMQKLAPTSAEKRHRPLRIALINGVGTMLGDTLVGSRALEIAVEELRIALGPIEIHIVLAWNARPGAEGILRRSPAVTSLQEHALTLEELRGFDAYWDFSSLLSLEGYDSRPLIDFYLEQFAIASERVAVADKLPILRLPATDREEARHLIDGCRKGRPVILLQALASTPLRSMPEAFLLLLLADILRQTDACVLLTQALPLGAKTVDPGRVVQLAEWCAAKTERFLSLFAEIDVLVSVDTLAIHAALAEGKPGVAIFTTMDPALRLSTASRLEGFLIPDAQDLPFWGKHKEDANWGVHQPRYEAAWFALDRHVILRAVCLALTQPKANIIHNHSPVGATCRVPTATQTLPPKESEMPLIKIDEMEYDLEQFSEEARAHLASLQFVDAELQRLNAQAAVLQTARLAYSKALSEALPRHHIVNK